MCKLQALAVNGAGHPADLDCMIAGLFGQGYCLVQRVCAQIFFFFYK